MQKLGVNREFCDKMGHDIARLRPDGTPSGYLSETAVEKVMSQFQPNRDS